VKCILLVCCNEGFFLLRYGVLFSVLTHKFNLVELLVVPLIANEGSILVMKGVSILKELGHCFMSQSFIDLLFGLSKQSSFFAVLYLRIGYCHIISYPSHLTHSLP